MSYGRSRTRSGSYDTANSIYGSTGDVGGSYNITHEHYRTVKRMQRVITGATRVAPKPRLLQFSTIGLVDFFAGKQQRLIEITENVDVEAHEALEPLHLIVEFISFVVSGLVEEGRRIDDAIVALRKDSALLAHELRRYDVELQYRKQYVGTNVTRALGQFFGTRTPTSGGLRAQPLGSEAQHAQLREYADAIQQTREQLKEIERQLKALSTAQKLLRGGPRPTPVEERDAIIDDLSISQVIRSANHKLRDALLPFGEDAQVALPSVISLQEFALHVDIGLTAATDDLDACLVSLKKFLLFQEREQQVSSISEKKQQGEPSARRQWSDSSKRRSRSSGRAHEASFGSDRADSRGSGRSRSWRGHGAPHNRDFLGNAEDGEGGSRARLGMAPPQYSHASSNETDELLRFYCS